MKYVVHPIQVHVHRRGDLVDAETNAERSNVILQKYYDELSRTRSSKPVAKVRGRAGTPEGGPAAYPLRDAFAAVA